MKTVLLFIAALFVVAILIRSFVLKTDRPLKRKKHKFPLQQRLEKLGDLKGKHKKDVIYRLGNPLSKFTTPDCSIFRWKDEELEISIRFDQQGKYLELTKMN